LHLDDRPDPLAGVSSEAARAGGRMAALRSGGTHELSPVTRRLIGWAVVLVIVGFFVAAFAGLIDIVPVAWADLRR
jgi:hypothetical protein